jgi:hypothetical protein
MQMEKLETHPEITLEKDMQFTPTVINIWVIMSTDKELARASISMPTVIATKVHLSPIKSMESVDS